MKTRLLLVMLMITVANLAKTANLSDTTQSKDAEDEDQSSILQPQKAITMQASYTGDIVANMFGGIKTGIKYLGMANLKVGFDAQNAKLWKGGQFFINGAVTQGQSPTEFLIGDFQTVSNIDAGDHIYVHELWYKQQFKYFEITFGLQDLNVEFAASDNGS
ncbi:MAG TPA: hypothetical protein DCQ50_20515, partial [Chryseobacterium sp.]|nr:hypothetical protein [Chryseobacterium sp.]